MANPRKQKKNKKKVAFQQQAPVATVPKSQTMKGMKKRNKRNNSRNSKVDTAAPNQIVEFDSFGGEVTRFTKSQLQQLRAMGARRPEGYVRLAKPNTVYISNDAANGGLRNTWEAQAEACIMAALAASPLTPVPGGPAVLKFYLCYAFLSRVRLQRVQGLMPGTWPPANYSSSVLPDFDENNWKVPVAFAKFIQSMMPYKHPNGAVYQYIQQMDKFFDNYAGNTIPTFSSPSINVSATEVWNRSVFGNNILRQTTYPTGTSVVGEYSWGLDPNAEGVTLTTAMAACPAISRYWDAVGTSVEMAKVPFKAFDGTFYSFVNSSASQYPGIYSNVEFVDDELSYIYHQPNDPTLNTQQSDQVFRFVKSLPAVLTEVIPTNINPSTYPAQAMMIINYAFLGRISQWVNGGRKKMMVSIGKEYPGIKSFKPNYYMVDLNGFAEMVEEALDIIFTNCSYSPTQIAVDPRVNNNVAAVLTLLPSVLLSFVMRFTYPGLVFYSNTDIASGVAVSSEFKNSPVPPLLCDYITGLRPTVTGGQLFCPILDWRNAPAAYSGTTFVGLATGTDWVNGRWIYRLNPNDGIIFPAGQTYYEMYTPSSAPATSTTPPSSQDRAFPFATGVLVTGGNTNITWGNVALTTANIYGGAQSPITPIAASRYIGSTPLRYAHDLVLAYRAITASNDSSFVECEEVSLGIFANLNPVTAKSVSVVPGNSIQTNGVTTVQTQLRYQVQTVGSGFSLDPESIGRSSVLAYKRVADTQLMPFNMTVSSAVSPIAGLMSDSCRVTQYNSWNTEFNARLARAKLTKLQVIRSLFGPRYAALASETSTEDFHAGDAVIEIKKQIKTLGVSPYHTGVDVSLVSFNSPNLMNQVGAAVQNRIGAGKNAPGRIPFLSPVGDFLGDIFHSLFGMA